VVVTDLALPGIDGVELCRRLRSTPTTSHIPIIALTGHSTEIDDRERAVQAGSDAVLSKPCDPKRLIAELHRVLARSQELSRKAKLAMDDAQAAHAKVSVDRVARHHMRRRRERANALRQLRLDYLKLPGLRNDSRGERAFLEPGAPLLRATARKPDAREVSHAHERRPLQAGVSQRPDSHQAGPCRTASNTVWTSAPSA
jgi:hypothetical protein